MIITVILSIDTKFLNSPSIIYNHLLQTPFKWNKRAWHLDWLWERMVWAWLHSVLLCVWQTQRKSMCRKYYFFYGSMVLVQLNLELRFTEKLFWLKLKSCFSASFMSRLEEINSSRIDPDKPAVRRVNLRIRHGLSSVSRRQAQWSKLVNK